MATDTISEGCVDAEEKGRVKKSPLVDFAAA